MNAENTKYMLNMPSSITIHNSQQDDQKIGRIYMFRATNIVQRKIGKCIRTQEKSSVKKLRGEGVLRKYMTVSLGLKKIKYWKVVRCQCCVQVCKRGPSQSHRPTY